MPGPIEATGAIRNPTKYGALGMGARQFTGLWTQRSPYRDAAVEYLVSKFYSGSRFDSILDGLNREITQRLTDQRAPGSSVYNSNTFPAGNSLYPWKYIQNGVEQVRVVYDGTDGTIYDATAGQKSALYAKAAGAGPARFLGVNTELFFGDGAEVKKILRSGKTWVAASVYNVGDFIIDPNGNIQLVIANPVSFAIADTALIHTSTLVGDTFGSSTLVITLTSTAPAIPSNQTAKFSGLTTHVVLNGVTFTSTPMPAAIIPAVGGLTPQQLTFPYPLSGSWGTTADTGTMVAMLDTPGTSGGAQPAWSAVWGHTTADNGVSWTCMGPAGENWGITPISAANPSLMQTVSVFASPNRPMYLDSVNSDRFWSPNLEVTENPFSILDPNGNIQVSQYSGPSPPPFPFTGSQEPQWATTVGGVTPDNGLLTWLNYGPIGAGWFANATYGGGDGTTPNICVIVDSNGNLQVTDAIDSPLVSGGSAPAWATSTGSTTTDGAITWINMGPASILWSGDVQYAWSCVGVDGTVGTASPVSTVLNGGLGPAGDRCITLAIPLAGTAAVTDKQIYAIKLWRTAQGQATLIELDQIPNPFLTGATTGYYRDASLDADLNPFIPAPIAEAAQPPQANMTAPVYYQQRVWGIVENMVVYSGGPDTVTGNGNTAFPPLNEIPFIAQPVKLIPVLVQNGGLIVMTTGGIKIILGTGTPSNPYYVGDYLELVSVLNYSAVDVFYNQIFCMESNGKVSSLAIEYPFNPQGGYTEVGFPIGDQFVKTTTGGQNSALFNPTTASLSWNANSSADTGMYVSNGTGYWFRMSLVNPPESGILWSPLRELEDGASVVQSVETAPGIRNLLIGPPAGTPGPILMRDTTKTVWTDLVAGTPTPYPSWDAKGVNLLCSTGQWAEVAHISTKSAAVGARPQVSALLGEIAPSAERPYRVLNLDDKSNDPSKTPKSISAYCDRYMLKQSGANTLGDCLLAKFDYGSQAFGDELLDFGILARVHDEREEEVAAQR